MIVCTEMLLFLQFFFTFRFGKLCYGTAAEIKADSALSLLAARVHGAQYVHR